jgi:hypothetical protein
MEWDGTCDKCGRPVDPRNDAIVVDIMMSATPQLSYLLHRPRHLLPTADGCPGSRSRAQYLEGQPRHPDQNLYPYDEQLEPIIRGIYAAMQMTANNTEEDEDD